MLTNKDKAGNRTNTAKPKPLTPEQALFDPGVLKSMFALKQKETEARMKEYENQALLQQAQAQEILQGNFEQNRQMAENMAAANLVGTIAPQIMGMNAVGQQATAPELPMSAGDLPDYTSNLRNIMVQQENANARNEQDAIAEMLTKQMASQQALAINNQNIKAKAIQADLDRKNKIAVQEAKNAGILASKGITNPTEADKNTLRRVQANSKRYEAIDKDVMNTQISETTESVSTAEGPSGITTTKTPHTERVTVGEVLTDPSLYSNTAYSKAVAAVKGKAKNYERVLKDDGYDITALQSFVSKIKKLDGYMNLGPDERLQWLQNNAVNYPWIGNKILLDPGLQKYILYSTLGAKE
jgi:hypothetical protein